MAMIKEYKHIHPSDTALSFDIKRMEAIYAHRKGQADDPHRHNYYIILLVKKAKGQHFIDFHEFRLADNQVFFISPGQVHQIIEHEQSFGYALTFSPQFMLENGIDQCFIDDLHLFQDYGFTPPLELPEQEMNKLFARADEILAITQSDLKFKYQGVGALLKLLLIHCNNACTLAQESNTQAVQASVSLLRDFKNLLNQHYKQWHKVADYATALHITADYLNASVKSLSGKSAKEHIQSRIVIAAKRLLIFSNLPAKSIAYELGFSEPANFSQFYKKCTGLSPSQFRKQQELGFS
jgi:AraC family transcriptional activator of pobA